MDVFMDVGDSYSDQVLQIEEGHGDAECQFCEIIPDLFRVLTGLVRQLEEHIQPTKVNTMIYELQKAEHDMHAFKVRW
jgi:hypothetical protein